uniref:Phospholipase-like protein n=1 Tax=Tanacetum cinerariifolium TaxID=118510 RepID=A0A699IVS3_TANCI|nr:phospholipase-like protein [Tanacetum cinerariifolium]
MSTLLELSAIAKSNNLKDMMILLFESENQKELITDDNMNMIAKNLSIRVSKREMLIVSFSSYSKGDMKFKERVFPHRVGLSITSLYLVGVIEDEEYFSQLCDEYAIHVCLSLCLEVIFMGKLMVKDVDETLMRLVESLEAWNAFPWGEHIWMQLYDEIMNVVDNHKSEHLERLHKSRKYVPTYTLGGFVWSFKVWILKSFEMSNHWWNKLVEAIPRDSLPHVFLTVLPLTNAPPRLILKALVCAQVPFSSSSTSLLLVVSQTQIGV